MDRHPAEISTSDNALNIAHLRTLWTQLTEINSAITLAREQQIGLWTLQSRIANEQSDPDDYPFDDRLSAYELADKQSKKMRALRKKLEGLRDLTRLTINERLRPNLRPLKILDLPDEVLRHIFEYVRGNTGMRALRFFDMGGDTEPVENLRLTCKRFCETSSHLLMYYIRVDMTPRSLSHLNEVSQHPTISKGIRAVKISLGRHYDSHIAYDIRAFAQYQALRMWRHMEGWRFRWARDQTPEEVWKCVIERATPVAESWEEAAQHGVNENCPEHALLRRAQQQYRQSYETQRLLEHGAFAQAITSAMTRMPTATWLRIVDDDIYNQDERDLDGFDVKDLDNPDLLQLKLQAPQLSWNMASYHGLKSPPIRTIPSILLSIEQAGIHLIGLDLRVPLPNDLSSFSTTEIKYPKLRATSRHLKAFSFRSRSEYSMPSETLNLLSGFLSAILDTSALQSIDLDFNFMYRNEEGTQPTVSIAPLILSRTWPNLKELTFNGSFYFEELQKVVNVIGNQIKLQWSGYLMNASWLEVLEFLRGRVSRKFSLGDANGSIAGGECDDMTMKELKFIFHEDYTSFSPSKATQFIRRYSTMKSNPVKDWENGDLVLPESEAEDTDF